MQLLLLAQLYSACGDAGDDAPKAAESSQASATKSNAEAVEALLATLRSIEQLPGLLLTFVRGCVQDLQEADVTAGPGQLPEALPGQAPGCGELLKGSSPSQMVAW